MQWHRRISLAFASEARHPRSQPLQSSSSLSQIVCRKPWKSIGLCRQQAVIRADGCSGIYTQQKIAYL
ncbi:hypothetical protein KRP22_008275 [Phytophthora ramorum]|uniref:uncharacterized protein n=1 Tax=Phytophthora ramorum TaxID=164328 RepID=UPI0030AEE8CD|nr:hypothetical protein KRP23_5554 [Phytophthora ramorum]KAH7482390.1 hypothetical protein KRP23_5558 [Phytophthora ramorum]KAH7505742.1 hypothetical protein KRP22_3714 [Phytophthora ramorum]KAH7505746.1 hypothetical protein KRP22_3718 [Phytophthora ramorum]